MEKGPNILAYQKRLSEAGYAVKQDGIYGPETKATTALFQKEHGITPVTGIPDAATRDALNAVLKGRTMGPVGITGEGPRKWGPQELFNVCAALLAGLYLWEHFGGDKA